MAQSIASGRAMAATVAAAVVAYVLASALPSRANAAGSTPVAVVREHDGKLAFDCSYTNATGRTYNFSSLYAVNGSYLFTQTNYGAEGKLIVSDSPDNAVTYTYELQICGNVRSQFPACKEPSPVNRISTDGTTCDKFGDLELARFSENPYLDGAYLSLWGGDDVDHIHKYQSRIYFKCDPTALEPRPYFEGMTDYYQSHFRMNTHLAC